jgi:hypothetical protein
MKILHIISNIKFTEPYIGFANDNFNSKDHLFLILNKNFAFKNIKACNAKILSKNFKDTLTLIREMNRSNKIILHAIYPPYLTLALFMQPWLLKKCYWSIFGSDLYFNKYKKYRKNIIISNAYGILLSAVIRNIAGIITAIEGDYELAKKWHKAKGEWYPCFKYPSKLYKNIDEHISENHSSSTIIQIGNSADPLNCHLEIFSMLEECMGEQDVEIVCPLSYACRSPKYNELVMSEGKRIFGKQFHPIVEFMPIEEYLSLLANIDIAIFNNKRQQALGNIITLLGFGKKVYIRNDTTSWGRFKSLNIKVFSTNNDPIDSALSEITKNRNIEAIKKHYSLEVLVSSWRNIFDA